MDKLPADLANAIFQGVDRDEHMLGLIDSYGPRDLEKLASLMEYAQSRVKMMRMLNECSKRLKHVRDNTKKTLRELKRPRTE